MCNEGLVIRKKSAWIYDQDLVELYAKPAKAIITRETIPRHAAEFHVRYFWREKIKFAVVNPEVDASWAPPATDTSPPAWIDIKAWVRLLVLGLIRRWFSQSSRNAKLDIFPLMRCTKCHSELMAIKYAGEIVCMGCGTHFESGHNILYIK